MIVFVEGSIGSGKSTLLQQVQDRVMTDKTVKVVPEGVQDWQSVKDDYGVNVLAHFYNDINKYSFVLQMTILTQRHFAIHQVINEMRQLAGDDFLIIMERSSASTDRVFRYILPLSSIEHAAFDYIYNKLQEDIYLLGVKTKYVYIDTPAEVCSERIKCRGRSEEHSISLDYLRKLETQYKRMAAETNAAIINGSNNSEQVLNEFSSILSQLLFA